MKPSLPSIPPLKNILGIIFIKEVAETFLCQQKVFYERINCSRCKATLERNDIRKSFRCRKDGCNKEYSYRIYTFFYGSHLNCAEIMHIAYLWLNKNGREQIINQTGHAKQTISNFLRYFRSLICTTLTEEDTIIGGEGIIVELDETKLGKRKFNRGHRVEGVWIFVGVERTEERRVFCIEVEDRKAETLLPLIEKHVAEGSIIHTDMYKSYMKIQEKLKFIHKTVNHSKTYKDPVTGVHTNTVEGNNNALKMLIKPRNRTKGVAHYLGEFIWRRKHFGNLWNSFLSALKEVHYEIE